MDLYIIELFEHGFPRRSLIEGISKVDKDYRASAIIKWVNIC